MYQWLVFTHLVGLVVFAMCHGVAIFSAFRIRALRDSAAVRDQLELAKRSSRLMYIGLTAARGRRHRGGVVGEPVGRGLDDVVDRRASSPSSWRCMPSAASYYYPLRDLVDGTDGAAPADGEALAKALDSRRPEILLAIGGGGLLVLIWLMVLKPA